MRAIKYVDRMGMLTAALSLFTIFTISDSDRLVKTEGRDSFGLEKPEAVVHFTIGGVT